jgi:hypothetical protein
VIDVEVTAAVDGLAQHGPGALHSRLGRRYGQAEVPRQFDLRETVIFREHQRFAVARR